MYFEKIIFENERQRGTLAIFDWEYSPDVDEIGYLLDFSRFKRGIYAYAFRLAEISREDLEVWGLMPKAERAGEFYEWFAKKLINESPYLHITCGNSANLTKYDGIQEYLNAINGVPDRDGGHIGFSTPEEALIAGERDLRLYSRRQQWDLFMTELYEATEELPISLNWMKMLDFELWEHTEAPFKIYEWSED